MKDNSPSGIVTLMGHLIDNELREFHASHHFVVAEFCLPPPQRQTKNYFSASSANQAKRAVRLSKDNV